MNPGINTEPFELLFEEKCMDKGDILEPNSEYWVAPWYIKIFGFKYIYLMIVLDEPIQVNTFFKYKVKLDKKFLYWFNIKVYTFKTKLD